MQAKEPAVAIEESRQAIPVLSVILILSFVAGGVLRVQFGLTADWAIALFLLAIVTAFGLEWVAAWFGIYARHGGAVLGGLLLGQTILVFALGLQFGNLPNDAASDGVAAFVIVAIAAVIETAFLRARTVLRVFRGLKESGDRLKAMAFSVLAPDVVSSYKPEIIEERLLQEIESSTLSGADTYVTKKADTDFGFNIVSKASYRILYRVHGRFIEALYLYEDGVVGRFERGEDACARLRFVLGQGFHFAQPSPEEREAILREIETAYRIFAAPTFKFHEFRKSLGETWRIRGRAILAALAAIVVVIIGFIAVLNVKLITTFLAQSDINGALSSTFYLVGIVAVAWGAFTYIYRKGRGKSAK